VPAVTPARLAVAETNVLTNLIHIQRNSPILASTQAISWLQVPRFLKVTQQAKAPDRRALTPRFKVPKIASKSRGGLVLTRDRLTAWQRWWPWHLAVC